MRIFKLSGRARALTALAVIHGLTAGCGTLYQAGSTASRKAPGYAAADETLYRARLDALNSAGTVGNGEAAYDPLESVPGAPEARPLATARTPMLSTEARAAARAYAAARNSSALIIWRDGAIEEERYFGPHGPASAIVSKSLAKPVTALLIGRAIMQGHIGSLDQPVADFMTEWRGDPGRSRITIRHLLGMRSGLLPQALGGGPGDMLYRAYLHPRHDEIIINEYPLTDEPGSVYEYSNANAELIAPIIERATGMRYAEYLSKALLQQIGAAGGSVWVNRDGGTAHSGCCLMLPARDWLRMAILLLDDGVWEGTRLLPAGYVDEMKTAAPQNPHYGLGLWLAGPYVERRGYTNPRSMVGAVLHSEPYLDRDLVLFDGNANQVVYLIPSRRMIVVRTGAAPPREHEWDNAYLPNLLVRDILGSPDVDSPEPQPR